MRSARPHRRLLADETRLRHNFRRSAETLELVQPRDQRKAQCADIVERYCAALPARLGPITEPGLRVLLMLWRYGELAPAELAELVTRDVTNASRAVDRLAEARYVTAQSVMCGDRLDYRLVSINDRGHSALNVLVEVRAAALDAAVNAMDRRPELTPRPPQARQRSRPHSRNRAHGDETAH
jgi:DNA-binding MarR family transcriptional regulator